MHYLRLKARRTKESAGSKPAMHQKCISWSVAAISLENRIVRTMNGPQFVHFEFGIGPIVCFLFIALFTTYNARNIQRNKWWCRNRFFFKYKQLFLNTLIHISKKKAFFILSTIMGCVSRSFITIILTLIKNKGFRFLVFHREYNPCVCLWSVFHINLTQPCPI